VKKFEVETLQKAHITDVIQEYYNENGTQ